MATVHKGAFRSKELIDAFDHALTVVRAEHAATCEDMRVLEKIGRTDEPGYAPPEQLDRWFKTGMIYAQDINEQLTKAKTADDQEYALEEGADDCSYSIMHTTTAPQALNTVIRIYQLADAYLSEQHLVKETCEEQHEWHEALADTIGKMQLDYDTHDALCALQVEKRQADGAKKFYPSPFSQSYAEFHKAHPERNDISFGDLTEDEHTEIADRVDAHICELLEPFTASFGDEDIDPTYAWFVVRALQMHAMERALSERKPVTSSALDWQSRIFPGSRTNQRQALLNAANDNVTGNPYSDPALVKAVNQTVASIFDPLIEQGEQLDGSAILAAQRMMERRFATVEAATRSATNTQAPGR